MGRHSGCLDHLEIPKECVHWRPIQDGPGIPSPHLFMRAIAGLESTCGSTCIQVKMEHDRSQHRQHLRRRAQEPETHPSHHLLAFFKPQEPSRSLSITSTCRFRVSASSCFKIRTTDSLERRFCGVVFLSYSNMFDVRRFG